VEESTGRDVRRWRLLLPCALLLLVGIVVGIAVEPDDGTVVSDGPAASTSALVGANHAKPLPRLPLPSDLLAAAFAVTVVTVLLRSTWVTRAERREPVPCSGGWRGRPSALRGPPLAA
jgi:hypothetical protein